MAMSFSHFVKHLPYTISRCLTRRPPLSTSSFANHELSKQTTPTLLFTRIFICSSSFSSINSPFSKESASTSYLSVRIRCRKRVSDMFSEALLCFGASSTSVDEEVEYQSSDEIYIDTVFPECEDLDACISWAADSIGLKDIPSYEVNVGEQCDWIKKSQESFHPVEVSQGLWIVPEWRTPPDPQAINIILNPGLAFGTGEHPTTKLCLLLLKDSIRGGEHFLDYGTGSGILAIAAVKFGASMSVGVDIDPQAITSACYNAAINDIAPENIKLHLVPNKTDSSSINETDDGFVKDQSCYEIGNFEMKQYDVVIANILLNPLLELADHIASYAKPGAVIGISGILSGQLQFTIDRYSEFLEGMSIVEMDDWICVSGSKKPNLPRL